MNNHKGSQHVQMDLGEIEPPTMLVVRIKHELFRLKKHHRYSPRYTEHETRLTQLLNQLQLVFSGNFLYEPYKVANFQLERNFLKHNLMGHFMVNLNKLNAPICQKIVLIFQHLVQRYVVHTKRPLVEKLAYKGEMIFTRLCHLLANSPHAAPYASQLLALCAEHVLLARKLVNLYSKVKLDGVEPVDEDANEDNQPDADTSTPADQIPCYVQLLKLATRTGPFSNLVYLFNYIDKLLTSNVEVSVYCFTRDLHLLMATFNKLILYTGNSYTRQRALQIFVKLIKNRYLQILIHAYSEDVNNFRYCPQYCHLKFIL